MASKAKALPQTRPPALRGGRKTPMALLSQLEASPSRSRSSSRSGSKSRTPSRSRSSSPSKSRTPSPAKVKAVKVKKTATKTAKDAAVLKKDADKAVKQTKKGSKKHAAAQVVEAAAEVAVAAAKVLKSPVKAKTPSPKKSKKSKKAKSPSPAKSRSRSRSPAKSPPRSPKRSRKPSEYALFTKTHMKKVRAELTKKGMKGQALSRASMKRISELWRKEGHVPKARVERKSHGIRHGETVAELKAQAKVQGIRNYTKMKKTDLMKALGRDMSHLHLRSKKTVKHLRAQLKDLWAPYAVPGLSKMKKTDIIMEIDKQLRRAAGRRI